MAIRVGVFGHQCLLVRGYCMGWLISGNSSWLLCSRQRSLWTPSACTCGDWQSMEQAWVTPMPLCHGSMASQGSSGVSLCKGFFGGIHWLFRQLLASWFASRNALNLYQAAMMVSGMTSMLCLIAPMYACWELSRVLLYMSCQGQLSLQLPLQEEYMRLVAHDVVVLFGVGS